MTNIEIRHFEEDDNTYFTTKDLRFNNNTLITPFKSLDFNDLKTVSDINTLDKNWLDRNQIIEKSHNIKQDTFLKEIDKPDAPFLSRYYDSYKKIPVLSEKSVINTLTLSFNPCKIPDYEDSLDSFLDIYHGRSDILFVPNLKVKEYDRDTKKPLITIQPDDFLNYINCAYDSLKFRNSKPIFVPVSTRYGINPSVELAEEMLDLGYRYFWFDLEGRSTTKVAGHMRRFHRLFDKKGLDDKVVLYGSNIKREINPHKKDSASAASDILATPIGFDFVGVNKETQKAWFANNYTPPPIEVTIQHKGRLFDPENYQYVKFAEFEGTKDLLTRYGLTTRELKGKPAFYSDFINSYELNKEFEKQRYTMQYENSLIDYLGGKSSITNTILKSFEKESASKTKKSSQKKSNKTLNDFM